MQTNQRQAIVDRQDWASLVRDTAAERRYMPGVAPRTTQVLLLRPDELEGAFNLEFCIVAHSEHDTRHTRHDTRHNTRDTRHTQSILKYELM